MLLDARALVLTVECVDAAPVTVARTAARMTMVLARAASSSTRVNLSLEVGEIHGDLTS